MKKTLLICLSLLLAFSVVLLVACNKPETPPIDQDEVSIQLNQSELQIAMGQSATIGASVSGSDEAPVWISSSEEVAQVKNGVVTGVKDGTAVITATVGGKSANCTVTVKSEESLSLDRETVKLYVGQSVKVDSAVKLGFVNTQSQLVWKIENESIATVQDSVVSGVKAGETKMTVSTANGTSKTVDVRVMNRISLNMSLESCTMHPNRDDANTVSVTVNVKRNGRTVSSAAVNWISSDESIVSVSGNGAGATFTAKRSGIVAIYAEFDGEYGTCIVDSWYAVSTPADMELMRSDKDGKFVLQNDVDFQFATWDAVTPWAGDQYGDEVYWGGTLDGNGYAIKNINLLAGWNKGIIGQTSPQSVVKNLSLINCINQASSTKCGSIVSFNKGLIENCYIETTINGDSLSSEWNCHGGIVATNATEGIIRNCIVKVSAARIFKNTACLVGYNYGLVQNTYGINTDANLPMVYTQSTDLGSFENCAVFKSEDAFAESAQTYTFSDKVWTITGYGAPTLKYFSDLDFNGDKIYFTLNKTYTLSPSNVKGLNIDWIFAQNADDLLDIVYNPDGSVTLKAKSVGETSVKATIPNGKTASAIIAVRSTVLVPNVKTVKLDFNHPALANSAEISFCDEDGSALTSVTFRSSDESVATVDEHGNVTACGAGKAYISAQYAGEVFNDIVEVNVVGWIQISTAEQLQAMENDIHANYCLVNDIDFGGETFKTITPYSNDRTDTNYFSGIFDGNGFTVSNVKISGNDCGIWGETAEAAIIRNTNFVNIVGPSNLESHEVFGVVAFNKGLIENCTASMVATRGADSSRNWRGGGAICGTNEFRGRITNCIGYLDTTGMNNTQVVASVVGLNQGSVSNCIGIYSGNGVSVDAVGFQNGFVNNVVQYGNETTAVNAQKPFGSFSTEVWEIFNDKLPVLKRLV